MPTTSSCFELIHIGIWGPYAHPDLNGNHYFLTIVDDFSKATWVFLMKYKSQTSHLVQQFYFLILNQFNISIKQIRTDNGPEFSLVSFYAEKEIIHQKSCVYTPQQNSVVERKHHQHLLNVTRALLFQ